MSATHGKYECNSRKAIRAHNENRAQINPALKVSNQLKTYFEILLVLSYHWDYALSGLLFSLCFWSPWALHTVIQIKLFQSFSRVYSRYCFMKCQELPHEIAKCESVFSKPIFFSYLIFATKWLNLNNRECNSWKIWVQLKESHKST